MRAFVDPFSSQPGAPPAVQGTQIQTTPAFFPFHAQAFAAAHKRHVPVFLIIGTLPQALCEPSLAAQIAGRTVPVRLRPGERPDVEALCLRASALFSGESSLPLCALLLSNGCPFLAAPLPPEGYPLDPQRLLVWLLHADRRFSQNLPAFTRQAAQVAHDLHAPPLQKPYTPRDAAHDLSRALSAAEDTHSGGFGGVKSPFVCALRFLLHESSRGSGDAHASLQRALSAMLTSTLCDPLDGGFFRTSLTDDWRGVVPEKPLGVNALLAHLLLKSGRRTEAVRTLDFILDAYPLEGGALAPYVHAPLDTYAFTPAQVCAALGSEEGLRACRLLGLLRRYAKAPPALSPSRFSPPAQEGIRPREEENPPLFPAFSPSLTPDDTAFLRRALPVLLRVRAARTPQRPAPYLLSEDCALAANVLALCGRQLGEPRYTQAAQRAVSALLRACPPGDGYAALPPALSPAAPRQPTAGAAAALALALLQLGKTPELKNYADAGFRLLGTTLHAFMRSDGMLLHTTEDRAAFFPRIPALEDSELPSPAATLVNALRIADELRPHAHYADAIDFLWRSAAPHVKRAPMAHAALIDAMNE